MEETKKSGKTNVDLLGDCRPVYRERAQKLKTRLQSEQNKKEEQDRIIRSGGLTAQEYWRQRVRCEGDVEQYYRIYRPDIPQEVAKAIAIRFTRLLEKINSKGKENLTEEEVRYFQKQEEQPQWWNPKEEIERERAQGLVKRAEEQMNRLMSECG